VKELDEAQKLLKRAAKKIEKYENSPRIGGYFSGEYISVNLSGMVDKIEKYNELYDKITGKIIKEKVLNKLDN
jgi:hypothetical protein